MVIKEQLSKKVMKQPLPKKIIISKTNETIIFIFNGYQKLIETVSNDHIKQTVSTITKGPFALKTFSYVSIVIVHVPPTSFLFRYPTTIIRCSFPFLFYPLSHSLHFVSSPLFVSFLIIMRGSVSKEKIE